MLGMCNSSHCLHFCKLETESTVENLFLLENLFTRLIIFQRVLLSSHSYVAVLIKGVLLSEDKIKKRRRKQLKRKMRTENKKEQAAFKTRNYFARCHIHKDSLFDKKKDPLFAGKIIYCSLNRVFSLLLI